MNLYSSIVRSGDSSRWMNIQRNVKELIRPSLDQPKKWSLITMSFLGAQAWISSYLIFFVTWGQYQIKRRKDKGTYDWPQCNKKIIGTDWRLSPWHNFFVIDGPDKTKIKDQGTYSGPSQRNCTVYTASWLTPQRMIVHGLVINHKTNKRNCWTSPWTFIQRRSQTVPCTRTWCTHLLDHNRFLLLLLCVVIQ